MKQVEQVRKKLRSDLSFKLRQFRSWISCIPGNEECVQRLTGAEGDGLLADLVERTMAHLGHVTSVTTENHTSRNQPLARRVSKGSL